MVNKVDEGMRVTGEESVLGEAMDVMDAYLDDLVVVSETASHNLKDLREVLQRRKFDGLGMKRGK